MPIKDLPMAPRYWKRRIKSSMGGTVIRPLVELITNSADSYKRSESENEKKIMIYYSRNNGNVTDEAEGMSRQTLLKVIPYGAKTSGRESGKKVRGHFGIGLKDAALALDNTHVISIKNDKINAIKIFFDSNSRPKVDDGVIINKDITEGAREKYKIMKNGTVVKFDIPSSNGFGRNKSSWVCNHLIGSFLLRKILSSDKYSVFFIDGENNTELRLRYNLPEGKEILKDKFEIKYKNRRYKVNLIIKKANRKLTQTGEYRDGGILIFFNEDSILDCSLFGYDHDFYAQNFFGEAEIIDFDYLLKKDEPILSDERKGLDYTHEFNRAFKKEMFKRLRKLVERERKASGKDEKELDIPNKNRELKIINGIIKQMLEDMGPDGPPSTFIPPNGLGFYYKFLDVIQKEPKFVYLVVDKELFGGKKIDIKSTTDKLVVSPTTLIVPKKSTKESDERYFKKKIELFGEYPTIDQEVVAKCGDISSTILVTVHKNPKLETIYPLSFITEDTTIVENKKKKLFIIIKSNKDISGELKFKVDRDGIDYPSHIKLTKNNYRKIDEDIYEVPVIIKGLSLGKVVNLRCIYKKNETSISVEVIESRDYGFKSLIKGFREDATRNPNEISSFEDGIIYVHTGHPVIRHYIKIIDKDFGEMYRETLAYSIFRTNIIVERICHLIVLEKNKRGQIEILFDKATALDREFKMIYYNFGPIFHNAILRLSNLVTLGLEKHEE